MSGPDRIGANKPTATQTTTKPTSFTPKIGTLASSQVAERAIGALESARVPTSSASSLSLTSAASLTESGSSSTFNASSLGLAVLGVSPLGEPGMFDGLASLKVTPQDLQAMNTETGKAIAQLSEKKQENALATLMQMHGVAQNLAGKDVDRDLKDAVGIGQLRAYLTAEGDEGAHFLNGEGGKSFGDFSRVVAEAAQNHKLDLKNMPMEDAVMLLFMLVSEDTRKDVRSQLEEMDTIRRKKASMRQAKGKLNEELARLKADAQQRWQALPLPKDSFDTFLATQKIKMPVIVSNEADGTAEVLSSGMITDGGVSAGLVPEAKAGQQVIGGEIVSFSGYEAQVQSVQDTCDSFSEITDSMQTKMQLYMQAMTQADTMNSNLMKKCSDVCSAIIANLK